MGYVGAGSPPPPAVEVVRSGIVESVHRAHVAVVDPDGQLTHFAGDPWVRSYPRSTLKPVLAAAMVELGFQPADAEQAALAASSHSGEDFHVAGVESMLDHFGLTPGALRNTPDWPFDEQARVAWIAAGNSKSSVAANCSGKHTAMLATCLANDWPLEGYLDPEHPLRGALADAVSQATGCDPDDVGVDGCGAAVWAVPLTGLARAFAALTAADEGSPGRIIADGMRAAPEFVGGTRRESTALMRSFPGMVAKDGADGVYGATLPDGRGVAIKIEDGAGRARPAAIGGVCLQLGLDADALAPIVAWEPVSGGGVPVGEMRPVVQLSEA